MAWASALPENLYQRPPDVATVWPNPARCWVRKARKAPSTAVATRAAAAPALTPTEDGWSFPPGWDVAGAGVDAGGEVIHVALLSMETHR